MDSVFIKDIRQGMKNFSVTFIVLEVGNPILLKDNKEVRTIKVADSSACINLSLWDEPGNYLVPGDIVRLTKASANVWRNCLTLYASKNGDIDKIGDFTMVFNEQLNMSEPNLTFEPPPGALINMGANNGTINNGGKLIRPQGSNSQPPSMGKSVPRFQSDQQSKLPNKVNNKAGRGGIRNMVRPERR